MKRILKRIIFYSSKFTLKIVNYFNHRVFMKYYIPLLKKQGMLFEGVPRYIGINVIFDDFNMIKLGDRVVISDECHFLTHDYSLTTALIAINEKPDTDIALIRPIEIGNNVFIGKKTIIMPGTKINNNVIIGAGSVVRGNIPEGTIVVGNPSQIIGDIYHQAEKWKKYLNTDFTRIDKK